MDAKINYKLFSEFGARLLQSYVAGGTPVENHFFHGVNRTEWEQLKTYFGLRPITLTVIFAGDDLAEATLHKSQLDSQFFGKCFLQLPDGYIYDCHAVTLGDAEILSDSDDGALLQAEYSLEGIRHESIRSVIVAPYESFVNPGTMPFTDCKLSVTVGSDAESYELGGAIFHNVTAGEKIEFNGLSGKILRNYIPDAANVTWTHFPYLEPGVNWNYCVDTVIVTYSPAYI